MTPQSSRWAKPIQNFMSSRFPRDPRWVAAAWAVIIFVTAVALLSASLTPGRYELGVGQVAPEDIAATRTIVDRIATERARETAAAAVPDQYQTDPQITANAESMVSALFAAVREANADTSATYAERQTTLEDAFSEYAITLDGAAVSAALEASPERVDSLESRLKAIIQGIMQSGVKQEYLDAARSQAADDIEELSLDRGEEALLKAISEKAVTTNMVFNAAGTQAKREEAMAAVPSVRILKGQMIVRAGDIVTEADLAILQDLGLLQDRPAWGAILGIALIVLLLEGAVGLYLSFFNREILRSQRRLSLFALLVLLTIVLAGAGRAFSGFVIPVAAGTMLLTILLNVRLGIFMSFVFGSFIGLLMGNDLRFALVAIVGGLAGAFATSRLAQRRDLMRAGLIVAGANTLAIVAVGALAGQNVLDLVTLSDTLWGGGNGIFAAVLTIGSLPFLEDIFGVLTPVKLLELANPNQPLLHRLLMEAPGTYHHSIIVANLAEAGVTAVGGNPSLARVGALYHDIGKARRPYFFIDNQYGTENPHDRLSPNLSALIVTSHVRDGVTMAEEAGLPQEVIDLIHQHHGNSLVAYFYSRAAEDPETEISEEDFRYDCPKPQTREAAILMLADSCEAAVRSLTRPTPIRIENMVRKIIRDKLDDNQLEQSPLTFRDLDIIAEVFKRVLTACFHQRIDYPEIPELKGRNGDAGKNNSDRTMGSRNGANGSGGRANGRPNGGRTNGSGSRAIGSGSRTNGNGGSGRTSGRR